MGRSTRVVYISVLQHPTRFMSVVVRGEGDPRSLVAPIRTALAQTDPDLALYWLRTFDESRMVSTAGFRIIGTMFAVFAGVALVLAAAGLFGVLAFHVGQRTREIGVRRALGADDGRILRLVMRASGVQILLGVGIGMTLLPLMGRGLGDVLGDASPYDPAIYGMVVVAHGRRRDRGDTDADAARAEDRPGGGIALRVSPVHSPPDAAAHTRCG